MLSSKDWTAQHLAGLQTPPSPQRTGQIPGLSLLAARAPGGPANGPKSWDLRPIPHTVQQTSELDHVSVYTTWATIRALLASCLCRVAAARSYSLWCGTPHLSSLRCFSCCRCLFILVLAALLALDHEVPDVIAACHGAVPAIPAIRVVLPLAMRVARMDGAPLGMQQVRVAPHACDVSNAAMSCI